MPHHRRFPNGTHVPYTATRLDTGVTLDVPMASRFLVSDGYASCIVVMGVTQTRTYLVHIGGFEKANNLLKGWDRSASVMILRKTKPVVYELKVKAVFEFCRAHFSGTVTVHDIDWSGTTGVIAYRSTRIAYLESSTAVPLDEQGAPAQGKWVQGAMAKYWDAKYDEYSKSAAGASAAGASAAGASAAGAGAGAGGDTFTFAAASSAQASAATPKDTKSHS